MTRDVYRSSALVMLSLGVLAACGEPPHIAEFDRGKPHAEPACFEGHDGSVTVEVCEATDSALIEDERAGRWLPARARELRARTVIQYGSDENVARERRSVSSKRLRAYLIPHFDPERAVAGWDLFDEDGRIAILSLDLDDHWLLVYSQYPAVNGHDVRVSLERFLSSAEPIATRARALYAR